MLSIVIKKESNEEGLAEKTELCFSNGVLEIMNKDRVRSLGQLEGWKKDRQTFWLLINIY